MKDKIDILMISETKLDATFPSNKFPSFNDIQLCTDWIEMIKVEG